MRTSCEDCESSKGSSQGAQRVGTYLIPSALKLLYETISIISTIDTIDTISITGIAIMKAQMLHLDYRDGIANKQVYSRAV